MMYVDTNVIVRALLNDHKEHSPKAQQFFTDARKRGVSLQTSEAVIAEVFYVLQSDKITPRLTREAIADLVSDFVTLTGINFPAKQYFHFVVMAYKNYKIDFVDALLIVKAEKEETNVVSFDQDLDKVNSSIRIEPQ